VIVNAFAELTAAEVIKRLDTAGIANAQMNSIEDVWKHPQLAARERWRKVETPTGVVPSLLPPGIPEGCEPRMDPVPALGAHTAAIMQELGYETSQVAELRAAAAI
jgi:itaconate CoA-transferase